MHAVLSTVQLIKASKLNKSLVWADGGKDRGAWSVERGARAWCVVRGAGMMHGKNVNNNGELGCFFFKGCGEMERGGPCRAFKVRTTYLKSYGNTGHFYGKIYK